MSGRYGVTKRVAALLLAAGGSSRMGRPKQLMSCNGESLLLRTARNALASRCSHLFVVVGAESKRMEKELAGVPVTVVVNRNWQEGMGSSIRAGMHRIDAWHTSFDAVSILLADQPLVTSGLIDEMVKRFEKGSGLVASAYAGTVGVPALFSSKYFEDLKTLEGDKGAKGLLKKMASSIDLIDFPEGAFDIDTPRDLKKYGKF